MRSRHVITNITTLDDFSAAVPLSPDLAKYRALIGPTDLSDDRAQRAPSASR